MKHFYKKKGSISINIESLYLNHIDVIKRYDFGQEEIHQMIDRFLPQIVEESYEFNVEMYKLIKHNKIEDRMEILSLASLELLDIILYYVSINSTLIEKYKIDYKEFMTINDLSINKEFILNDGKNINNNEMYEDIINKISKTVLNSSGNIRRISPNRKYHKKNEKISEEEHTSVINSIFFINHKSIEFLLSVLFEKLVLEKDIDIVLDKVQDVVKNK